MRVSIKLNYNYSNILAISYKIVDLLLLRSDKIKLAANRLWLSDIILRETLV